MRENLDWLSSTVDVRRHLLEASIVHRVELVVAGLHVNGDVIVPKFGAWVAFCLAISSSVGSIRQLRQELVIIHRRSTCITSHVPCANWVGLAAHSLSLSFSRSLFTFGAV